MSRVVDVYLRNWLVVKAGKIVRKPTDMDVARVESVVGDRLAV